VVQMVVDDIGPSADLVLTLGPPHIVRTGEAPVIAECWIPAFRVANIRETGNGKEGETAAAQVRTVIGSAKTEHIRPDISSIIRGLSVFAHALTLSPTLVIDG